MLQCNMFHSCNLFTILCPIMPESWSPVCTYSSIWRASQCVWYISVTPILKNQIVKYLSVSIHKGSQRHFSTDILIFFFIPAIMLTPHRMTMSGTTALLCLSTGYCDYRSTLYNNLYKVIAYTCSLSHRQEITMGPSGVPRNSLQPVSRQTVRTLLLEVNSSVFLSCYVIQLKSPDLMQNWLVSCFTLKIRIVVVNLQPHIQVKLYIYIQTNRLCSTVKACMLYLYHIYIYIYRNNDVCVKNMTCKCTLNALKKKQ